MSISKFKKLRKYFMLISGVIFIILITGGGVSADSDKVNRNPGNLKFDVEEPVSWVPAHQSLTVRRNGKNTRNIYYRVVDNSSSPVDLAKYVMARTPYSGSYESLDRPVLFLAKEDESAVIHLRLRVDNDFWTSVPDGRYSLLLISDWGKSVDIRINIDKVSFMTVAPDIINIYADKGPGAYYSQEAVTVYINNINNKWNLDIMATSLLYQGKQDNNNPVVEPADIYLSIDNRKDFRSLENVFRINGNNYGSVASIDMFFKIDVGYEHLAGKYKGQIIFTISEN